MKTLLPEEVVPLSSIRDSGDRWTVAADRMGRVSGLVAQHMAELVDLAVEGLQTGTWAGEGIRSPEHWLAIYTNLSPAQCSAVIAVAGRHEALAPAIELMRAGRMSLDQASVIARHVPDHYVTGICGFAETMSVTQLRRVLSKYGYDPAPDEVPHDLLLPSKRAQRDAELSMGTCDGRFTLRFSSDATTGAIVEQAIREAKDAAFAAGHEEATLADGLIDACSRSLAAIDNPSRREHYKIMIHLDTSGQGWISQTGAVPSALLQQFTCDGTVRPVWETDGQPVSVGRAMRIVPLRTRRLVEDRDRTCRFPGCGVTRFLENHHITHWSAGGSTDYGSLVSLCPHHHREHHKGKFLISGDPTTPDGLVFTFPSGHRIARRVAGASQPCHRAHDRFERHLASGVRGEPIDGRTFFIPMRR